MGIVPAKEVLEEICSSKSVEVNRKSGEVITNAYAPSRCTHVVLCSARLRGIGYHLWGCHSSPIFFTAFGACFGCTYEVGMASWGACSSLSHGGIISQLYAQRKVNKSEKRNVDMRSNRKEIKRTTNNKTETDKQTHCTKADYNSARHSLLVRISTTFQIYGVRAHKTDTSKLKLSSCRIYGYGQHKARTI